jgi:spore coat polysaccharide biosynthesis protein SpsF
MTGIVIVARLGSTRLKQKHLIEVENNTLIQHLANRIQYRVSQSINEADFKIIIATADEPGNRKFEELEFSFPVSVYYGSIHNLPLRQLECAEDLGLDNIISIDGDDILVSCEAIVKVFDALKKGAVYIKTAGLPLGMNIMGYSTAFLKSSLEKSNHAVLETGWGRIFDAGKLTILELGDYEKDERLRFTLDYPEDADFFVKIISHFNKDITAATDAAIIDFVIGKEVFNINAFLNKTYWDNFSNQVNTENN